MALERASGGTSLIDVLDRVLDKGVVIDAWGTRLRGWGIALSTLEGRVVVASIDTSLVYSEAVGQATAAARPAHPTFASDDEDNGGGGSSGAPAMVNITIEPRRYPPGRQPRTRRTRR